MSRLATAAKEALRNKQAEEEAARLAIAESTARAGVKRARRSDLGRWFPEVEWEFVANLSDGTTVVREKGGLDTLLGIKVTGDGTEQGPDEWEVAVYEEASRLFVGDNPSFRRIEKLATAAALGEYLERNQPQPANDEDVPA